MVASSTPVSSPFHSGERDMQSRVGLRNQIEKMGGAFIRPFMPDQHRHFFGKLPFLVLGSTDADGWPWASIVSGRPGFLNSPHDTRLDIDGWPLPDDPLAEALRIGAQIGAVGIELSTRRRNRVNATVGHVEQGKIGLDVVQSFGNCPQYIQTQDVEFIRDPDAAIERRKAERFSELDPQATKTIEVANSFYVASATPGTSGTMAQGADVSHRGGRPGFVRIDGNSLLVPDFPGNNFFNTLGNFILNPRAGLLFPDFETGDLLMLTGRVEVLSEEHPDIALFHGASRGWRFTLHQGLRLYDALPFRAKLLEYSPNSLMADDWPTALARKAAEASRGVWRRLRVAAVNDESEVIRSFTFEPTDTLPLLPFKAGQFLTLRSEPEGHSLQTRTYTVSSAPGEAGYRISVKRTPDGVVSNHLHDTLSVGDLIDVKAPKGSFHLNPSDTRPALLLAGGVGVTPMTSMVRHVLNEGRRTRHMRPVTLIHAARSASDRAFHDELHGIAKASDGKIRYCSVLSQPAEKIAEGTVYDAAGRITPRLVQDWITPEESDVFLCGPPAFMQAMYDMALDLGIPDHRIFAESFGPSGLQRATTKSSDLRQAEAEAETATVIFESSDKEVRWLKGDPSLLETAEALGLTPPNSCRSGSCGSCLTRRISGKIAYRTQPSAEHSPDEVLICCAVPAPGSDPLILDL